MVLQVDVECRLLGHLNTVCSIAADENLVLTGSADKTAKVWRLENGKNGRILHTLVGHYKRVSLKLFPLSTDFFLGN